ncbi:MAG: hypothetical protein QM831_01950 [Kofleriaceae bacterium]
MKSLAILALLTGAAHADSISTSETKPVATVEAAPLYAIAVNNPISWFPGVSADSHTPSIGISAYAGVSDRVVIRGNIAYGANASRLEFQSECPVYGQHTDGSVTAQFYPSGRFDGFFLEGGPMLRSNPNRDFECEEGGEPRVTDNTQQMGGVALVGYTYTGGHFFFSTALGASYLYESGQETKYPLSYDTMNTMPTTSNVGRAVASVEWMLRLGAAW